MNRRSLTSIALAITSLGIVAAMNACSSAPQESPVGSTAGQSSEALTTCGGPFKITVPNCKLVLGKITCGTPSCISVTEAPVPDPSGDPFFTSSTTPPPAVAPPGGLAEMGCTIGVQLTAQIYNNTYALTSAANIWACPQDFTFAPPYTSEPLCPTMYTNNPPEMPLGQLCEVDYLGEGIASNAFVGAAMPGWILVERLVLPNAELVTDPPDGGADAGPPTIHGCEGGCPGVNGNGLSGGESE